MTNSKGPSDKAPPTGKHFRHPSVGNFYGMYILKEHFTEAREGYHHGEKSKLESYPMYRMGGGTGRDPWEDDLGVNIQGSLD